EIADRLTNCQPRNTPQVDVVGTRQCSGSVVDSGNFVRIMREVEGKIDAKIAADFVVIINAQLNTLVFYISAVYKRCRVAYAKLNAGAYQQVLCFLNIIVGRKRKLIIEEVKIQAKVGLLAGFPFQVGVGNGR